MPVRRFDSLDAARRELWADPGDPALPDRIRRLWALSRRLAHACGPEGLLKLATIEDANAERADRERRRARMIREGRSAPAQPSR